MADDYLELNLKAVELINQNEIKKAKNLILDILNKYPNNDQAWYLLSLTLNSKDKKIYALNQALNNNPNNFQAKSDLKNIQQIDNDFDIESRLNFDSETIQSQDNLTESTSKTINELSLSSDKSNSLELKSVLKKHESDKNSLGDNSVSDSDFRENLLGIEEEKTNFSFNDESENIINDPNNEDQLIEKSLNLDVDKFDLLEEKIELPGWNSKTDDNQKIELDDLRNEFYLNDFNQPRLDDDYIENKENGNDTNLELKKEKRKFKFTFRLFLITLVILFGSWGFYLKEFGYLNYDNGDIIVEYANQKIENVVMLLAKNTQAPATETLIPTETQIPLPTETPTPFFTQTPTQTPTIAPLSLSIETKIIEIQSEVKDIRGLNTFTEETNFSVSSDYLKNVLKVLFNSDDYTEKANIDSKVLTMLGLVKENYNIATHSMNSWVEGRGGLYLPNKNYLFFTGYSLNIIEQFVYAQEYQQFLIDQNFGIDGVGENSNCSVLDQACQAFISVIKGDAYLTSKFWAESNLSESENNLIENLVDKYYFVSSNLPNPFSDEDLSFNSTYGSEFVRFIYDYGGWNYLNDVYSHPPVTSEQIIHPEKYISGETQASVNSPSLNSILDSEWEKTGTGGLGEWKTYLILSKGIGINAQVDQGVSKIAASGWGGDIYQYYVNIISDEEILSVFWKMDSIVDREELYNALKQLQNNSFGSPISLDSEMLCWQSDNLSCIYRIGLDVLWIQSPNVEISNQIFGLHFE